jgi:hypothetical protein
MRGRLEGRLMRGRLEGRLMQSHRFTYKPTTSHHRQPKKAVYMHHRPQPRLWFTKVRKPSPMLSVNHI